MLAQASDRVRPQVKLLSVRLPESELRRLKTVAAHRGVSLQEAVHQALESWTLNVHHTDPEPLDGLQGSLADVDISKLMRDERDAEMAKEGRR